MNHLFTALARWRSQFKSMALADMHRMACGMSGVDLPQAPAEKRVRPLVNSPLQFSLRRRQHLAWQRFICGGSH
jgi:hypothetical protein